jgi:hypothetical protein
MIRALTLGALLTTLAACVNPNAASLNAAGPAPQSCDAGPAHTVFGRSITPALEQEALQVTGARTVRLLRPGQAITREYDRDRLNLQLNSDNVAVRAYCG